MTTPSFVNAGAGANRLTAGTLTLDLPASLVTGNVLQMHVSTQVGGGSAPGAPTTPAGWTHKIADAVTNLRQDIYERVVDGTEGATQNITVANSAVGRIYQFQDNGDPVSYDSGAGTAGTGTSISASALTTVGAQRLGLQFVAVRLNTTLGDFAGETGGDWVEAVAEFAGSNGITIQLQTVALPSATTISGGTQTLGSTGRWLTRSLGLQSALPVMVGDPLSIAVSSPAGVLTGPTVTLEGAPLSIDAALLDAHLIGPLVGDALAIGVAFPDAELDTNLVLYGDPLGVAVTFPNASLVWSVDLQASPLAIDLSFPRGNLTAPVSDSELVAHHNEGLGPGVWREGDVWVAPPQAVFPPWYVTPSQAVPDFRTSMNAARNRIRKRPKR